MSSDPNGDPGGGAGGGVDVKAWVGFFGGADTKAVAGSLAWFARELAARLREINASQEALADCPSTAICADLQISGRALGRVVKELDTTAAACTYQKGGIR